jgi:hypothetical protein
VFRAAEGARDVGALMAVGESAGLELGKFTAEHSAEVAEDVLNPFQALAKENIAVGNDLSQNLADTIKIMQQSLSATMQSYKNCGCQ